MIYITCKVYLKQYKNLKKIRIGRIFHIQLRRGELYNMDNGIIGYERGGAQGSSKNPSLMFSTIKLIMKFKKVWPPWVGAQVVYSTFYTLLHNNDPNNNLLLFLIEYCKPSLAKCKNVV